MTVAGKVVLITGAGLGFEYARAFGAGGAFVVADDVADCTGAAAGNGAALVNNAASYGSLRGGRFKGIPEADWDAAIAVNVKGIWNCCKAVVAAICAAADGFIVNLASCGSLSPPRSLARAACRRVIEK